MTRRKAIAGIAVGGLAVATAWAVNTPGADETPAIDLARYGFTKRSLDTSAGQMAVYELGNGDPILMLHGVGGGASSFYWFRLAPMLAANHRVIAPDWVGFGASEHPARELLFDDYVAQVEALIAEIGRPVPVIAQSLAAGFAIAAHRKGAGIERLAMLAPSGGFDFGEDAFDPVARNTLSVIARTPGLNRLFYRSLFHRRAAIRGWFEKSGFHDPAAIPDELIEAGLYSARQENAAYSALPFLAGTLRYDLAPFLRYLDIPTLMLWGQHETQIRPALRERLERVNPDIDVARIANARTNFEVEQSQATHLAISGFLKS